MPTPEPEEEGREQQDGPVTAVLVGAGDRGTIYATYALEQPAVPPHTHVHTYIHTLRTQEGSPRTTTHAPVTMRVWRPALPPKLLAVG